MFSLDGGRLTRLNKDGTNGEIIQSKKSKITFGTSIVHDHHIKDVDPTREVTCEISTDDYGRVYVHNKSPNEILLNGKAVTTTRPLLNNSIIKICDGVEFRWTYKPAKENISTENNDADFASWSDPAKKHMKQSRLQKQRPKGRLTEHAIHAYSSAIEDVAEKRELAAISDDEPDTGCSEFPVETKPQASNLHVSETNESAALIDFSIAETQSDDEVVSPITNDVKVEPIESSSNAVNVVKAQPSDCSVITLSSEESEMANVHDISSSKNHESNDDERIISCPPTELPDDLFGSDTKDDNEAIGDQILDETECSMQNANTTNTNVSIVDSIANDDDSVIPETQDVLSQDSIVSLSQHESVSIERKFELDQSQLDSSVVSILSSQETTQIKAANDHIDADEIQRESHKSTASDEADKRDADFNESEKLFSQADVFGDSTISTNQQHFDETATDVQQNKVVEAESYDDGSAPTATSSCISNIEINNAALKINDTTQEFNLEAFSSDLEEMDKLEFTSSDSPSSSDSGNVTANTSGAVTAAYVSTNQTTSTCQTTNSLTEKQSLADINSTSELAITSTAFEMDAIQEMDPKGAECSVVENESNQDHVQPTSTSQDTIERVDEHTDTNIELNLTAEVSQADSSMFNVQTDIANAGSEQAQENVVSTSNDQSVVAESYNDYVESAQSIHSMATCSTPARAISKFDTCHSIVASTQKSNAQCLPTQLDMSGATLSVLSTAEVNAPEQESAIENDANEMASQSIQKGTDTNDTAMELDSFTPSNLDISDAVTMEAGQTCENTEPTQSDADEFGSASQMSQEAISATDNDQNASSNQPSDHTETEQSASVCDARPSCAPLDENESQISVTRDESDFPQTTDRFAEEVQDDIDADAEQNEDMESHGDVDDEIPATQIESNVSVVRTPVCETKMPCESTSVRKQLRLEIGTPSGRHTPLKENDNTLMATPNKPDMLSTQQEALEECKVDEIAEPTAQQEQVPEEDVFATPAKVDVIAKSSSTAPRSTHRNRNLFENNSITPQKIETSESEPAAVPIEIVVSHDEADHEIPATQTVGNESMLSTPICDTKSSQQSASVRSSRRKQPHLDIGTPTRQTLRKLNTQAQIGTPIKPEASTHSHLKEPEVNTVVDDELVQSVEQSQPAANNVTENSEQVKVESTPQNIDEIIESVESKIQSIVAQHEDDEAEIVDGVEIPSIQIDGDSLLAILEQGDDIDGKVNVLSESATCTEQDEETVSHTDDAVEVRMATSNKPEISPQRNEPEECNIEGVAEPTAQQETVPEEDVFATPAKVDVIVKDSSTAPRSTRRNRNLFENDSNTPQKMLQETETSESEPAAVPIEIVVSHDEADHEIPATQTVGNQSMLSTPICETKSSQQSASVRSSRRKQPHLDIGTPTNRRTPRKLNTQIQIDTASEAAVSSLQLKETENNAVAGDGPGVSEEKSQHMLDEVTENVVDCTQPATDQNMETIESGIQFTIEQNEQVEPPNKADISCVQLNEPSDCNIDDIAEPTAQQESVPEEDVFATPAKVDVIAKSSSTAPRSTRRNRNLFENDSNTPQKMLQQMEISESEPAAVPIEIVVSHDEADDEIPATQTVGNVSTLSTPICDTKSSQQSASVRSSRRKQPHLDIGTPTNRRTPRKLNTQVPSKPEAPLHSQVKETEIDAVVTDGTVVSVEETQHTADQVTENSEQDKVENTPQNIDEIVESDSQSMANKDIEIPSMQIDDESSLTNLGQGNDNDGNDEVLNKSEVCTEKSEKAAAHTNEADQIPETQHIASVFSTPVCETQLSNESTSVRSSRCKQPQLEIGTPSGRRTPLKKNANIPTATPNKPEMSSTHQNEPEECKVIDVEVQNVQQESVAVSHTDDAVEVPTSNKPEMSTQRNEPEECNIEGVAEPTAQQETVPEEDVFATPDKVDVIAKGSSTAPRSTRRNRNLFENDSNTPKQTPSEISLASSQDTPQQTETSETEPAARQVSHDEIPETPIESNESIHSTPVCNLKVSDQSGSVRSSRRKQPHLDIGTPTARRTPRNLKIQAIGENIEANVSEIQSAVERIEIEIDTPNTPQLKGTENCAVAGDDKETERSVEDMQLAIDERIYAVENVVQSVVEQNEKEVGSEIPDAQRESPDKVDMLSTQQEAPEECKLDEAEPIAHQESVPGEDVFATPAKVEIVAKSSSTAPRSTRRNRNILVNESNTPHHSLQQAETIDTEPAAEPAKIAVSHNEVNDEIPATQTVGNVSTLSTPLCDSNLPQQSTSVRSSRRKQPHIDIETPTNRRTPRKLNAKTQVDTPRKASSHSQLKEPEIDVVVGDEPIVSVEETQRIIDEVPESSEQVNVESTPQAINDNIETVESEIQVVVEPNDSEESHTATHVDTPAPQVDNSEDVSTPVAHSKLPIESTSVRSSRRKQPLLDVGTPGARRTPRRLAKIALDTPSKAEGKGKDSVEKAPEEMHTDGELQTNRSSKRRQSETEIESPAAKRLPATIDVESGIADHNRTETAPKVDANQMQAQSHELITETNDEAIETHVLENNDVDDAIGNQTSSESNVPIPITDAAPHAETSSEPPQNDLQKPRSIAANNVRVIIPRISTPQIKKLTKAYIKVAAGSGVSNDAHASTGGDAANSGDSHMSKSKTVSSRRKQIVHEPEAATTSHDAPKEPDTVDLTDSISPPQNKATRNGGKRVGTPLPANRRKGLQKHEKTAEANEERDIELNGESSEPATKTVDFNDTPAKKPGRPRRQKKTESTSNEEASKPSSTKRNAELDVAVDIEAPTENPLPTIDSEASSDAQSEAHMSSAPVVKASRRKRANTVTEKIASESSAVTPNPIKSHLDHIAVEPKATPGSTRSTRARAIATEETSAATPKRARKPRKASESEDKPLKKTGGVDETTNEHPENVEKPKRQGRRNANATEAKSENPSGIAAEQTEEKKSTKRTTKRTRTQSVSAPIVVESDPQPVDDNDVERKEAEEKKPKRATKQTKAKATTTRKDVEQVESSATAGKDAPSTSAADAKSKVETPSTSGQAEKKPKRGKGKTDDAEKVETAVVETAPEVRTNKRTLRERTASVYSDHVDKMVTSERNTEEVPRTSEVPEKKRRLRDRTASTYVEAPSTSAEPSKPNPKSKRNAKSAASTDSTQAKSDSADQVQENPKADNEPEKKSKNARKRVADDDADAAAQTPPKKRNVRTRTVSKSEENMSSAVETTKPKAKRGRKAATEAATEPETDAVQENEEQQPPPSKRSRNTKKTTKDTTADDAKSSAKETKADEKAKRSKKVTEPSVEIDEKTPPIAMRTRRRK